MDNAPQTPASTPLETPAAPLSKRLYHVLTHPNAEILDVQERRKASTISMALVAMIPVALLSLSITLVAGLNLLPPIINLGVLTCAYFTSRTRQFRIGGILAIISFLVTPALMYFADPSSRYNQTLLSGQWVVFSLLMAVLVLNARQLLVYSVITMITTLILGFSTALSNQTSRTLSANMIIVFSGFAVLMYLIRLEDLRERTHAKDLLREREQHYRTIVELMSDYAYSLRVEPSGRWVIEWVEGAWTAITGLTPSDVSTLVWKDHVHPDDLPELAKRRENLMANRRDVRDLRIITKSGDTRYIRDYGFPVWSDTEQRTVRIIGAVQDITLRKQSDAEALEQQRIATEQQRIAAEQQRLAEALRDTTAVLSNTLDRDEVLDRILEQVNKVITSDAADILVIEGSTVRVARACTYNETNNHSERINGLLLGLEDLHGLYSMYATGKPVVIEDTSNASSDVWTKTEFTAWIKSYIGVPIVLDGITMGFLNLLSSTPNTLTKSYVDSLQAFANQAAVAIRNAVLFDEVRRYADALGLLLEERSIELNSTRERLEAIVESSADGIYYTEGTIIQYANPAFSRLLGYSVDELVGKSIVILRPESITAEESLRRDNIPAEVAQQGVWRGEVEMRRKNGDTFVAGVSVSFISGRTPEINVPDDVRAVTIVRDITKETMVRQQQSHFVAHASHELRTPLTNFSTRLHLLRRDPARLMEHVDILDEVAEQMRRLVSDLLDLSRFERGVIPLKMEHIKLQTLLSSVVRIQQPEAERKSVILRAFLPDPPLDVLVDQDRIRQVFTNLITNAIHYTDPGGTIDLILEVDADTQWAVIHVRDSGIGIPESDLPFIFQPFYRVTEVSNRSDGAGLGLSIAKEIVEKHGGQITVESEVRKGTTFTIQLKLAGVPTSEVIKVASA